MLSITSVIPNIKSNNITTDFLDNVFETIRTDSNLHDTTASYRSITEELKEKREFKIKSFPVFFPTVWLGEVSENKLHDVSIPTGIIQFDADAKDNPHLDLEDVRKRLLIIPELVYLFVSPSEGLKFGIKTDFHRHKDDTIQSLKDRYKVAYGITNALILEREPELILDDTVGNLKFGCFICHDSNVYYNGDCNELVLDKKCYAPEKPKETLHLLDTIDKVKVAYLLSDFILRSLRYPERLKINSAVFSAIGAEGIPLLLNHWIVDDRVKLLNDLKYQSENVHGVSIGYLYKTARENGYPNPKTGRARRHLTTKELMENALSTGQRVEGLKTLEEARIAISDAVDSFIAQKTNKVISSSVGIGKTEIVLDVLKQFQYNQKVLYVSNTHSLLSELNVRFKEIKHNKSFGSYVSSAIHIQGRNRLCENKTVRDAYGELPIPIGQCHSDCPLFAQCAYTLQFGQSYHNIRFMAANALFNAKGHFEDNWNPDYIIIDEDCLKIENHTEGLNSHWKSIRLILNDLEGDVELGMVILNHKEQVMTDYYSMKNSIRKQKSRKWVSMEETIKNMKSEKITWSEILSVLFQFVMSEDKDVLRGMRSQGEDGRFKLKLSVVPSVHPRWKGIPFLILDATADEKVMKHLYPDISWVSAHAVKKKSVKVIQLENYTITKKFLIKSKNVEMLIDSLSRYIEVHGPFEKIGLITYKNTSVITDFDAYLASEIGATIFGHFGDIRGKDGFKDCDLLIVCGRHEITPPDLDDWCYGIFNQPAGGPEGAGREIVDVPIRTPEGAVMIENYMYVDKNTESTRNHICKAETIQSNGRIRMFLDTGRERKVLFLSSESMGLNIEVDDFISYSELFEKPKEVDNRTTAEKKKNSHKERLLRELENNLLVRNFPSVKDSWTAFVQIGCSEIFSKNKSKRADYMIAVGYVLHDGTWSINQA